jgi:Tfp pilus assembly protein PilX
VSVGQYRDRHDDEARVDRRVVRIQLAPTATVKGRVFYDKNSNQVQNSLEPGISNVWVGAVSSVTQNVLAFAYSDANGDYTLTVPANSPPGTDPYSIQCIPANGYYPVGSSAYSNVMLTGGQNMTGKNFALNAFQLITLTASRVLSLGTGDVMESDWNGNQTQNAHGDQDLLLGADANGTDQVSVWFNQYDSNPLFNTTRDYARTAPNAVLAMSVDTLTTDDPPFRNRVDLVTGTKLSGAGNFFTWFNQNSKSNEGYLPTTYTQAYKTADNGDVQGVVTANVNGGSGIDIIVGTKSPTTGSGTIELWKSNDAATPTYSFVERYPNINTLGYPIGEVTCMAIAKLRSTGQDLIVGTKTGTYSGQLLIFSRVDSVSVFKLRWVKTYGVTAVKCIAVSDITGDGKQDIVVGTQTGAASGRLELWRNDTVGSVIDFFRLDLNNVSFVPYAMVAGDFGGASATDVAVGYRSDESSYGGGVRIFYCDTGRLPTSGTDPSGGSVVNFVPALTCGNYNYGVKPALPTPPTCSTSRRREEQQHDRRARAVHPMSTFRVPRPKPTAHERGVALIMALLTLLVLSLAVAGIMMTLNTDTKVAGHQLRGSQAFYLAEAGVAEAEARIRFGDVPGTLNPKMVTQIFNAPAGSVPVLGTDSTALATLQPSGEFLDYSTATKTDRVLTISYKTDAARNIIYRYDVSKNPSVQTSSGFPIYVIRSTGVKGTDRSTVVTEVVQRPFNVNVKGAMACNVGIDFSGTSWVCGHDHSVDTPAARTTRRCARRGS